MVANNNKVGESALNHCAVISHIIAMFKTGFDIWIGINPHQYSLSTFLPADLNKACGNTMDAHEAAQMHQNFSQQLLQDHIAACSLPEHNLINVGATSAML